MKKIVWLTTDYFVDVDRDIVPYLSEYYLINWVILGNSNEEPQIYNELQHEVLLKRNIKLEYYAVTAKWYTLKSYAEYVKLFRALVQKDADIIYIDSSLLFGAFHAASKCLPKGKTVIATHNVKTPKGARLETFARIYMKLLLRRFSNFQVFSKNQYEYLKTLVSGKNVLYAPLALKNYGARTERTEHVGFVNFLSFGHIRKYKRIDLLIDAAQQLHEETRMGFVVTIAGSCPEWDLYKERIRYPHLFDLRIGFISDDDVAPLFSNADYLVLPYQDLAQSGAITVAFNYNLPVITSDIPQFLEFVNPGSNGYTFESENVNSLKDVMKRCLEMSQEQYVALKERTKQYVDLNYSLSSIGGRYIDYFNRMQ